MVMILIVTKEWKAKDKCLSIQKKNTDLSNCSDSSATRLDKTSNLLIDSIILIVTETKTCVTYVTLK